MKWAGRRLRITLTYHPYAEGWALGIATKAPRPPVQGLLLVAALYWGELELRLTWPERSEP